MLQDELEPIRIALEENTKALRQVADELAIVNDRKSRENPRLPPPGAGDVSGHPWPLVSSPVLHRQDQPAAETEHWARKTKREGVETMERIPAVITVKDKRLEVGWPESRKAGYIFATCWDTELWPIIRARLNQKTLFYITRKDRFINIIGLRA